MTADHCPKCDYPLVAGTCDNRCESLWPYEWECRYFESGTCIVQEASAPTEPFAYGARGLRPWLYIYGPGEPDDGQSNRYKVCEDVRDYLNGRIPRPKWLDDLQRTSEEKAEGIDRTSIRATGPMIDINPPWCHWEEDNSVDAKNARARLMDHLFLCKD